MRRLLVVLLILFMPLAVWSQDSTASGPTTADPPTVDSTSPEQPPSAAESPTTESPATPGAETPAASPSVVETPTSEQPQQPDPWKDYPAREVDRPVLPAANGYVMGVITRSFTAGEGLNSDGKREDLAEPISIFNLDISVRYGIFDRWEVFGGIPYATAQNKDFSTGSIGNAYVGTRVGLYAANNLQLAAGLQISLPTGDSEYHYRVDNGKIVTENFRTGNPGLDFLPEVELRRRVESNLSLRLRAWAIITGSGETVLNHIGSEDIKKNVNPGDGFGMQLAAVYQAADRWVIPVSLTYFRLGETEVSGLELDDEQELLEARAGLMFQMTPVFEVAVYSGLPLFGRNVYLATPLWLEMRTRF